MQKKDSKRVHNLIVDESGSMSIIHKQAFTGMNETLQTIRQMQKKYPDQDQHVTLLTFDTGHTTWHYDNTPADKTHGLMIWSGRIITREVVHLFMMLSARASQR